MFQDFEAVKIVALFALFVALVLLCIVVAFRDAKRRRREREERVKQQVEVLKQARDEAERRRLTEAQTAAVRRDGSSFRPSEFLVSSPSRPAPPSSSERRATDFDTSPVA